MPRPFHARTILALALALLIAGCASPSVHSVTRFRGTGCTEVGVLVPGDLPEAQGLMPEGFRARNYAEAFRDGPADRSLLVIAVNRCAFVAGEAQRTQVEAFVWLAVEPPPAQALLGATSQMLEAAHWRPAGPILDVLRLSRPGLQEAVFTGVPERGFEDGVPFNITATTPAGWLRAAGIAAPAQDRLDHPAGPCCRTFVRNGSTLLALDYTSTAQPYGTGACTVETTLPLIARLLGAARLDAPCEHNGSYDFSAEIHPV